MRTTAFHRAAGLSRSSPHRAASHCPVPVDQRDEPANRAHRRGATGRAARPAASCASGCGADEAQRVDGVETEAASALGEGRVPLPGWEAEDVRSCSPSDEISRFITAVTACAARSHLPEKSGPDERAGDAPRSGFARQPNFLPLYMRKCLRMGRSMSADRILSIIGRVPISEALSGANGCDPGAELRVAAHPPQRGAGGADRRRA